MKERKIKNRSGNETTINKESSNYVCHKIMQTFPPFKLSAVPPTITVPPEDVAVEIGQTASFHCSAVGIPTPKVEWFFETTSLSEGSDLSVGSVDRSRRGTYVCFVSSEAGTATALAKLIIFGKLSAS